MDSKKVSIVIPSRNERFLVKTVNDILSKHDDNIEIIVVQEGYWEHNLPADKRIKQIHHGEPCGMRQSINEAVAISSGEFILKIDGHCMVSDHLVDQLISDWQDDADIVIPRRKRLEPESWTITDTHKPDVDYEFVCAPTNPSDWGGKGLNGKIWIERILERQHLTIDENLSFQGSCWFMKRNYFYELELMDHKSYGAFWNEAQELGFKSWLGRGRVMTNKGVWYAHLHKGKKYGRGYNLPEAWLKHGSSHTLKWMHFGKAWHKQQKSLRWLIEKFAPVPTWENWQWED